MTRGSRRILNRGQVESLDELTWLCRAVASLSIDRNLYSQKGRRPFPIRTWLTKTGPEESSLTAIAATAMTGAVAPSSTLPIAMSMARFNRSESFRAAACP